MKTGIYEIGCIENENMGAEVINWLLVAVWSLGVKPESGM